MECHFGFCQIKRMIFFEKEPNLNSISRVVHAASVPNLTIIDEDRSARKNPSRPRKLEYETDSSSNYERLVILTLNYPLLTFYSEWKWKKLRDLFLIKIFLSTTKIWTRNLERLKDQRIVFREEVQVWWNLPEIIPTMGITEM